MSKPRERWLSGRKRRFAKPLNGLNRSGGSNPPLSAIWFLFCATIFSNLTSLGTATLEDFTAPLDVDAGPGLALSDLWRSARRKQTLRRGCADSRLQNRDRRPRASSIGSRQSLLCDRDSHCRRGGLQKCGRPLERARKLPTPEPETEPSPEVRHLHPAAEIFWPDEDYAQQQRPGLVASLGISLHGSLSGRRRSGRASHPCPRNA